MFRSFDVESREKFKFQLYKNRTEILEDIPNEFISNCVFKLTEPDSFDITVPKYIGKDKRFNPLFNKIKSKQQIIVSNESGTIKKRFVIEAKKQMGSSSNGNKKFSANGFQKTLERHRMSITEGNYQLISDETHIAKGILELALEKTKWRIGYVDPKARVENQNVAVTIPNVLFSNYKKDKIDYNSVIFEKDIDTSQLKAESPLYLTIEYNEVKTIKNGGVLKTENVINYLDPLYTQVKHIKATYYQEAGNRWGVKYELTLIDNVVETQTFAFTNVTGNGINIKEIKLLYETGEYQDIDMVMYPYLDSYDDNVYNILKDLESVFNCTFIYDTYNKVIDCYSKDNLGEDKGLMLSFDTNVIELNIQEDESIPNAMRVIGKDSLSISSENIFGGDIIYNYDYYISEGLISKELEEKWNRYLNLAEFLKDEWALLKSNRQLAYQKQLRASTELQSLSKRIAYGKEILATLMTAKDEEGQKIKQAELTELENKFNELSAEINTLQEEINSYDDSMADASDKLSREKATDELGLIFSEEDLEIFDDIEEVVSVTDSYYTVAYALLRHYEKELEDKVVPTIDFDMTTDDLAKYISKWTHLVKLGDLYYVDENMKEILRQDKVRLLEVYYDTINNRVTQVKFCNKNEKVDSLRNLNNTGRKTSQAVNVNNTFKNIWEDSRSSNNYVKSLRENGMTLVTNSINSRSDSCVLDMGSAGIWVMNAQDRNKQVAITSGIIAITTDGWKTSDTAITSEFINADLLMGKVIAGENLYITSDTGGFYVGNTSEGKDVEDFGLRITDTGQAYGEERIFLGLETDSDGVRRAKLRLKGKDGQLALTEEGIVSEYQYNDRSHIDPEAPFYSYLRLRDNISIIKEGILTVKFLPFRTFSKGMEYDGGYINTITSTSGGAYANSTASGGTYSSSTSDGGSYSESKTSLNNSPFGELRYTETLVNWSGEDIDITDGMTLRLDRLAHRHRYYDYVESHSHGYSIAIPNHDHRFYLPDHVHAFQVPNHSHNLSINIGKHSHSEIYGCFDLSGAENIPSNVSLFVNGQRVKAGVISDSEIDISAYLIKNKLNEIKFTSSTRGVIHINCYVRGFVYF